MAFILFEDEYYIDLLPFTFTRPVYDLRSGIFTLRERWKYVLKQDLFALTRNYLQPVFGNLTMDRSENHIWINGRLLPDEAFLSLLNDIPPNTAFINEDGEILATQFPLGLTHKLLDGIFSISFLEKIGLSIQKINLKPNGIRQLSDIFQKNKAFILFDFELITQTRKSVGVSDSYTIIYGKDNIFVEEGAKIRAAVINAEDGPIYIGKGVNIQEGALIKRTHAICEGASISMGSKLRGDSTVGPYSKAGGEVTNSVLMGYANKAHEGYLGNSVLGYWCNMGAGSNSSNLKNNYGKLKQWNYRHKRVAITDLQFCGLMMGDHSKCGINTMFNTGTVVGVFSNIFGGGYPPKFIPSFSWGGANGITTYQFQKACEVAERVMKRKNIDFTNENRNMLKYVFEQTKEYRLAN